MLIMNYNVINRSEAEDDDLRGHQRDSLEYNQIRGG